MLNKAALEKDSLVKCDKTLCKVRRFSRYTFLDGELEKTDHLICMAHAKVKFSKACEHGEYAVAKEFENMISELYDLEEGYIQRDLRRYNS